MKTRVLAFILAIVMCVSLLPVSASAAETKGGKNALSMMKNITVDYNDNGNLIFTWSPVSCATGYKIYRADTEAEALADNYKLVTSTSKCIFIDTTASAGRYYYYKLIAVDANGVYTDSPAVAGPALSLFPKPVVSYELKTNLFSNKKTELSWSKVDGIDGYIIMRGTTDDLNSMEALAGQLAINRKYTDDGWYDGYYYCIIGVKDMGDGKDPVPTVPAVVYVTSCEHDYRNTVKAPTCAERGYTTHTCTKCGYSYIDSYTDIGEHNFSVWLEIKSASCAAEGYEVHYCTGCSASEARPIAKTAHEFGAWSVTTEATCTKKGIEARSCASCGTIETREIAKLGHNYVDGKCTRCGEKDPSVVNAPKAPKISITTSAGKPKLSWSAVSGAEKYYIYRSTDGKNFTYLTATTKTSYTNTSAKVGTTYYYKVVAIKGDLKSAYSNVVSKQCVPAAPTVTIARSSGKAKLSWDKVSGATKYYIYRSTDGKTFKQLTSTTKTSYTDTKASSGKKYYYKVKAAAVVNDKNVYSSYSSVKSLLTTLATPTVKITTSSGKPKISWSKVTGADKYYIYRSTDGKTFKQLTTTTKTSYTNTSAKKNTKYYYKVKAVSTVTSSANSAQSKAVSIKATK